MHLLEVLANQDLLEEMMVDSMAVEKADEMKNHLFGHHGELKMVMMDLEVEVELLLSELLMIF
mgnify:CR=1 FL=1